ncbi:MAG: hypothetical protein WCR97_03190 [Bacilli bacterium]
MIDTEKLIQHTFIKLLKKRNVEEIDVNMICKEINIKRQTFYYHFQNIYDVIFSIYCYKSIPYIANSTLDVSIYNMLNFLYNDNEYNIKIAKSNARDVLEDFLYSYIHNCINKYLNKYVINEDKKVVLLKFFSKGIVEVTISNFIEKKSLEVNKNEINKLCSENLINLIISKF